MGYSLRPRRAAMPPAGTIAGTSTKMAPKRKADAPVGEETVLKKTKSTPAARKILAPKAAESKKVAAKKAVEKKPAKKAVAEKKEAVKPKKAAAKPKKAEPKKAELKKAEPKKVEEEESSSEEELSAAEEVAEPKPAPKAKAAPKPKAAAKPAPAPKAVKFGPTINKAPTQKLDVYVFGEGSSGELGLGNKKVNGKKPMDVSRPRLNENLSASKVGVVQISVGGMHCAALTHDNKILTWGVNDQGALGRDTKWEGGLKDMDDNASDSGSDSDDEDAMNPRESTPEAVDSKHFPEGITFTQVCASDSATFAVTSDGSVWGWGTFRSNDGILGFTPEIMVQTTPMKIPELKKITTLSAGANHILALDSKNNVWAWGSGQQNQLGRRVVERTRTGGLIPREFGLPRGKIEQVATGAYHSFAVAKDGRVFAWGLNNFGECGIVEGAGEDNAVIPKPTVVKELGSYGIKEICGGSHHSIACTDEGQLLAWGRSDGGQLGIDISKVPKEHITFDERDKPRMVTVPAVVPGIKAATVAAGGDNSFAVDTEGKAYSWGFSANYQTGQGSDDDVDIATLIDNTAVRGKKLNFAGAGGQFSILTAPAGK
ncbi:hypothetical protein V490_00814 [Pseudogymnoascus sp. VKM F-3557]|nr:hypothetical protein V490_00814 [Pseudogymnoascus sp. VKM F-3557]